MRLGRERPRKRSARRRARYITNASMRLGRERPRKTSIAVAEEAHELCFNEAGARTPQKGQYRWALEPRENTLQ